LVVKNGSKMRASTSESIDRGQWPAKQVAQGAVAAADDAVDVGQGDRVADGVEGDAPFPGRLLGLADAQQRPHRGQQLARLDRLDEVTVGAPLQPPRAVAAVDVDRRHVQHRRAGGGRMRLNAAADLEAVDVGQVPVEHDEVGLLRRQAEGVVAGGRFQHLEAFAAEDAAKQAAVGVVVIDEQNGGGSAGHGGGLPARRGSSP
jgi:hypothetical protein